MGRIGQGEHHLEARGVAPRAGKGHGSRGSLRCARRFLPCPCTPHTSPVRQGCGGTANDLGDHAASGEPT